MSIEWFALGFSIFGLAMSIFVWRIIKWMDKRTARLLKEAGGT